MVEVHLARSVFRATSTFLSPMRVPMMTCLWWTPCDLTLGLIALLIAPLTSRLWSLPVATLPSHIPRTGRFRKRQHRLERALASSHFFVAAERQRGSATSPSSRLGERGGFSGGRGGRGGRDGRGGRGSWGHWPRPDDGGGEGTSTRSFSNNQRY